MKFHMDYGLQLNEEPTYKNLYQWAINEVDLNGNVIGQDQIPWEWNTYFYATSCTLINSLEISDRSSWHRATKDFLGQFDAGEPSISTTKSIRMSLCSGTKSSDEAESRVYYSMFGTGRPINDFILNVFPLNDPSLIEKCAAWGSVSYTSELDFRDYTSDDCLNFYLHVKPDNFMEYTDLIKSSAVDSVSFSVGCVEGFYSNWSPSISTDLIKVLLKSEEHQVCTPEGFSHNIMRLGNIGQARLIFHRHLMLK